MQHDVVGADDGRVDDNAGRLCGLETGFFDRDCVAAGRNRFNTIGAVGLGCRVTDFPSVQIPYLDRGALNHRASGIASNSHQDTRTGLRDCAGETKEYKKGAEKKPLLEQI